MQLKDSFPKSLTYYILCIFISVLLLTVVITIKRRESLNFVLSKLRFTESQKQKTLRSLTTTTVITKREPPSLDLLTEVRTFMVRNNFSCPSTELLTIDSIFSYSISCMGPRHPLDIVFFNGQKVKSLFDLDNNEPHIPLHLKLKINRWSELTALVNTTILEEGKKMKSVGFHVHNELTFGDLLMLLYKEFLHRNKKQFKKLKKVMQNKWLFNMTEAEMETIMDDGQPPITITNTADENWGFLSTGLARFINFVNYETIIIIIKRNFFLISNCYSAILNRTTAWINMTNHLRIHNSNYNTVRNFLNSKKVILLLT